MTNEVNKISEAGLKVSQSVCEHLSHQQSLHFNFISTKQRLVDDYFYISNWLLWTLTVSSDRAQASSRSDPDSLNASSSSAVQRFSLLEVFE